MSEASFAVVAAGAGGVTVRLLHLQLGHLRVHAVQLRHAVLPQVLEQTQCEQWGNRGSQGISLVIFR